MLAKDRSVPLVARRQVVEPHRWTLVEEALVSFTIPGPISDACWGGFLDAVTAHRPSVCLMLCAGPASVGASQRSRSTHAFVRAGTPVVVLTDNRVTRGLAMTVAWLGAKLDAHPWAEMGAVLDRLRLRDALRKQLHDIALDFHAEYRHLDRA